MTDPIVIPQDGLEHTVSPFKTPLSWGDHYIGWDSCVPIVGHTISTRYVVWTLDPVTGGYLPSYPPWTLETQELEVISHDHPYKQEDVLYTADPGLYGIAVSGIVDDSCYDYFKVFDQTRVAYLEANGPYDSEPIENVNLPEVTDALTVFVPDERERVTVTYKLTTEWDLGVDETFITQDVVQVTDDWSSQVKEAVGNALFTKGSRPEK